MIFNMAGGGAPSLPQYAAISVNYYPGLIVTCSDGITTLTAPDTTGTALFVVPYAATWTITDGTRTKSVVITSPGQLESVNIGEVVAVSRDVLTLAELRGSSYMTYVQSQGSATVTEDGDDYFRLYTGSGTSYREWIRKIGYDVSEYSKLKVVGHKSGGNTYIGLSTSSSSVSSTSGVITVNQTSDTTFEADISAVTGTRYIYWRALQSYIYVKSISFMM